MDSKPKKYVIFVIIIPSFLIGLSLGLLVNVEVGETRPAISNYENTEIDQHLDIHTRIRSVVLKHEMIQNEIKYWHLGNISDEQARKKATFIYGYAEKYNFCPFLITALGVVESNLTQDRISYRGAIGITQLMPNIARYLDVNPYNMKENIKGGTKFLRELKEQYSCIELALAHYNAGINPEKKLEWSSVSSYVWNIKNISNSLTRRYKDELGRTNKENI